MFKQNDPFQIIPSQPIYQRFLLQRGLEDALEITYKAPLESPSKLLKQGDLYLGVIKFCSLADLVGARSEEFDALKKFAREYFDEQGMVASGKLNDYFYYSPLVPGLERPVPAIIPLAENEYVGFIFRSQTETFKNFGTFLRMRYKREVQIRTCVEKSSSDKRMVRFVLQEYRQSRRQVRIIM